MRFACTLLLLTAALLACDDGPGGRAADTQPGEDAGGDDGTRVDTTTPVDTWPAGDLGSDPPVAVLRYALDDASAGYPYSAESPPTQPIAVGQRVLLSALESSDPDGNALTYAWSVRAPGNAPSWSGADVAEGQLGAHWAGSYTVTLTVTEQTPAALSDTVTLTLEARPPPPERTWHPQGSPPARWAHALVYDSARDRVVMFGGTQGEKLADTWEFDGDHWQHVPTPEFPSPRTGHGLAFDARRGVVVLTGGYGETWEYDGATWLRSYTPTQPPTFEYQAPVYDAARGVVVAIDYDADHAGQAATWEYDGADWRRVITAQAPPWRKGEGLAYDADRGRVVLFGGNDASDLSDTWEYDGTDWAEVTVDSAPPPRTQACMVYDGVRHRLVMFGGQRSGYTPALADAWAFAAGAWTQLDDVPALPDLCRATVDALGRVVFVPGTGSTWILDGDTWQERPAPAAPTARAGQSFTYDAGRSRAVLFGSPPMDSFTGVPEAETWEWDGAAWTHRDALLQAGRLQHAAVYDAARARVLVFGGRTPGLVFDPLELLPDTLVFDGDAWTVLDSPTAPAPRTGHRLAYDSGRDRVVLFGGHTQPGTPTRMNDTWEHDGTAWTLMAPTASPPERLGHAMAFDAARGRTVIYGGDGATGALADTWEYDGARWVEVPTAQSPGPRPFAELVYDPAAQELLLFGGSAERNDTWAYDGSNWRQVTTSIAPGPRRATAMTFDTARGRLALFGGSSYGQLGDLWELE